MWKRPAGDLLVQERIAPAWGAAPLRPYDCPPCATRHSLFFGSPLAARCLPPFTIRHPRFAVFFSSTRAPRPGRWVSTNGGSPTHPRTVGARHAVPLPFAYPRVSVHERPGPSRRADGLPARCRRHNTTRGGSGTRPYLDQHHSPFAIRHSLSFTIRHSPLATRYSLRAARRLSRFATRRIFHSLFAVSLHWPRFVLHPALIREQAVIGLPSRCGLLLRKGSAAALLSSTLAGCVVANQAWSRDDRSCSALLRACRRARAARPTTASVLLGRPARATAGIALTIKARVREGRLVLDEPTDLPDGTEIELLPQGFNLAHRLPTSSSVFLTAQWPPPAGQ
jgi:hypothetical protein